MARAKDPVCGMMVDTESAAESISHGGQTWFFCSAECARKFRANPEAYVGESVAASGTTDDVELEKHEPPYTKSKKGIIAPKFGSAGSGGLEYERLPERHDESDGENR